MNIPFNLNGVSFQVETDFSEFRKVDLDSILKYSDDPAEIIAKAAYANLWTAQYGILLAQAEYDAANARLDFEMTRSTRKEVLRIENKEGKLTEARLKDLGELDLETVESERKYLEALKNAEMIKSIYWAMQALSKRVDSSVLGAQSISLTQDRVSGVYNSFKK